MVMKNALIVFGLFAVLTALSATSANAQYGQYGQYGYGGGTPTKVLLIDKMVGKVGGAQTKGGITDIQYIDNLSESDAHYHAEDQVPFKIKVKNASSMRLTNVNVVDVLPAYVEPLEGPGDYNASARTITFNAGDLEPGQEKIFYIKLKVLPSNQLPADKGIFCLVNRSRASAENLSNEDTAQFCVEKQVVGVTQVPSTGPEMAIPLLFGEFTLLGAGLFLTKKAA